MPDAAAVDDLSQAVQRWLGIAEVVWEGCCELVVVPEQLLWEVVSHTSEVRPQRYHESGGRLTATEARSVLELSRDKLLAFLAEPGLGRIAWSQSLAHDAVLECLGDCFGVAVRGPEEVVSAIQDICRRHA